MVIVPTMDVVIRGVLIRSATKLGSGSDGISTGRKLSGSLALPTITIRVVRTFQMVFTNPITTIHVNRTIDRPLMSSMVIGGYINADAMYPIGGY